MDLIYSPSGIRWMKRSAILLTRSGIFKTHTQGTPDPDIAG
jgi:hypothetical protein